MVSQHIPSPHQCRRDYPLLKDSLCLDRLDDLLADLVRAGRVLARDDIARDDDLLAPRLGGLDVLAAAGLDELVLEHEGHELAELDLVLLDVAEARHLPALEQRRPVGEGDVDEGGGAVAHGGDDLAARGKVGDELAADVVDGEVEHGAVAARVEDGVVGVGGAARELGERLGGLPEVLVLLEEGRRRGVRLEHLDRGGVEGRDAALGRGEGQLGARLDEDVVGVGELGLGRWEGPRCQWKSWIDSVARQIAEVGGYGSYQVPASGLAGAAHLVVGGENDEDLGSHGYLSTRSWRFCMGKVRYVVVVAAVVVVKVLKCER